MKTVSTFNAAFAVALSVAAILGTSAKAGILATDINALSSFRGSQTYTADVAGLSFSAQVEYAVYQPGPGFNLTFGAGADPSGGTQYVYAYQLSNIGTASQRTVGALSVGLDGSPTVASIQSLPNIFGNLGLDPYGPNTRFELTPPNSSARWAFSPSNSVPELTNGQFSEILLFTSIQAPHFTSSTVSGGGMSATLAASLPSPVPEPATGLCIISWAMMAIGGMRRRR
jgi:hypothetical protein